MESSELNLLQIIDEVFDQATPIIHQESESDYAILMVTHCGIRIKERVHSEQEARNVVNEMLLKMKDHPVGGNQTG